MSLTWENIGDTTANWKYGIITGTGTLTSTIVDNLLDTSEISNQVDTDISNGIQFGIKVVGYTTLGDNAFNPGTVYTAIQYLHDVILDTNLTTIGSQVLSSGSINSITIPPTVTSISRFAIAKSVEDRGERTFFHEYQFYYHFSEKSCDGRPRAYNRLPFDGPYQEPPFVDQRFGNEPVQHSKNQLQRPRRPRMTSKKK